VCVCMCVVRVHECVCHHVNAYKGPRKNKLKEVTQKKIEGRDKSRHTRL